MTDRQINATPRPLRDRLGRPAGTRPAEDARPGLRLPADLRRRADAPLRQLQRVLPIRRPRNSRPHAPGAHRPRRPGRAVARHHLPRRARPRRAHRHDLRRERHGPATPRRRPDDWAREATNGEDCRARRAATGRSDPRRSCSSSAARSSSASSTTRRGWSSAGQERQREALAQRYADYAQQHRDPSASSSSRRSSSSSVSEKTETPGARYAVASIDERMALDRAARQDFEGPDRLLAQMIRSALDGEVIAEMTEAKRRSDLHGVRLLLELDGDEAAALADHFSVESRRTRQLARPSQREALTRPHPHGLLASAQPEASRPCGPERRCQPSLCRCATSRSSLGSRATFRAALLADQAALRPDAGAQNSRTTGEAVGANRSPVSVTRNRNGAARPLPPRSRLLPPQTARRSTTRVPRSSTPGATRRRTSAPVIARTASASSSSGTTAEPRTARPLASGCSRRPTAAR